MVERTREFENAPEDAGTASDTDIPRVNNRARKMILDRVLWFAGEIIAFWGSIVLGEFICNDPLIQCPNPAIRF